MSNYTIEIVDNITETTLVISGSNYSNVYINDALDTTSAHISDLNNPHSVTASQIGLPDVINGRQLLSSQLEQSLSPLASGSVPSSKAVADYVSAYSPQINNAEDIVNAINASALLIDDNNIAATIARDSEVTAAISLATASLVNTSDVRLTNARQPLTHTHGVSDITNLTTTIEHNAAVLANTTARHAHDNTLILSSITNDSFITSAERTKLGTIETGATADMSASEIISLINGSASIINDARIASTIARDSEVTASIASHAANAAAHHSNINDPSATEKAALAGQGGVPSGTNKFVVNSDPRLNEPQAPASHASTHLIGGSDALPNVTTSASGLMTAADKLKLNGIESGASGAMNASEIISLINASALLIDDNNIASTIARTTGVQNLIDIHANDEDAHHSNANDPSATEKAALAGTSGTPAELNPYVTHTDSRMSNSRTPTVHASTHLHGGSDDIGLGTAAFKDVGEANGIAELDSSGRVPANQLPSYVDDVIVYNTFSAFPLSGESSKIYIASDVNLTYRWTGSSYAEISASLALGETSATAYRGDRGALAYNHISATGNVHNLTGDILIPLINTSSLLIDDNNIASTIARDIEVSASITAHETDNSPHINIDGGTSADALALHLDGGSA